MELWLHHLASLDVAIVLLFLFIELGFHVFFLTRLHRLHVLGEDRYDSSKRIHLAWSEILV